MNRRLTVWYDGACPLCVREIALIKRLDRRGRLAFEDVSGPDTPPDCPIDRADLLARFHVRTPAGRVLSGAAAFAAMWREIPVLSPLGHVARIPPVLWMLERGYRLFLRVRPRLQRLIAG